MQFNSRSQSTYANGFPILTQQSESPFVFYSDRFQFKSPQRTYLKTNEIKKRKLMHDTMVNIQLNKLLATSTQQHIVKKKIMPLSIARRVSACDIPTIDKNLQLWDVFRIKLEHHGYESYKYQDLFIDLMKQQNYMYADKYNQTITNKSDFYQIKHLLIISILQDTSLYRVLGKFQGLKHDLFNCKTLYQGLKGIDGINNIIVQLLNNMQNDITLAPLVEGKNINSLKEMLITVVNELISNQDDIKPLFNKIKEFGIDYQINHVHYTNFKYCLFKVFKDRQIHSNVIFKILKLMDHFKAAIIRTETIRERLADHYYDYISYIVYDRKNMEQQRKHIEILFEYLLNNYRGVIRRKDIQKLHLNMLLVEQLAMGRLVRYQPHYMLQSALQQDIRAISSPKIPYNINMVGRFCKSLVQIPFYSSLYSDNEINPQKLLEIELDCLMNNRTGFREHELRLIHKRFNITHAAFDLYVIKLQEILPQQQVAVVTERLNLYRPCIIGYDEEINYNINSVLSHHSATPSLSFKTCQRKVSQKLA